MRSRASSLGAGFRSERYVRWRPVSVQFTWPYGPRVLKCVDAIWQLHLDSFPKTLLNSVDPAAVLARSMGAVGFRGCPPVWSVASCSRSPCGQGGFPFPRARRAWGSLVGVRWWHHLRGDEIEAPRTVKRNIGHQHVLPSAYRTREKTGGVPARLTMKAAQRARHEGYHAGQMSVHARMLGREEPFKQRACFSETRDSRRLAERARAIWQGAPADTRFLRVGVTLHKLVPDGSATLPLFGECARHPPCPTCSTGRTNASGRPPFTRRQCGKPARPPRAGSVSVRSPTSPCRMSTKPIDPPCERLASRDDTQQPRSGKKAIPSGLKPSGRWLKASSASPESPPGGVL